MDSENSQKIVKLAKKYTCVICNYITSRKNDYDKHLLTDKHKKTKNDIVLVANDIVNRTKVAQHKCGCGNTYKYASGYYRHKKICVPNVTIKIDEIDKHDEKEISDKELIMMLLKQNAQLIEHNTELCKNGINSHNTTNSHNKTFNLQFFLHEECKDALNISEFVSSIRVELDDLEATGRLGYAEGVSRIINKNLGDLDQTKRPIHCSDVKREILYIKDDNQWIKENENKPIFTKAIKQIANENIKQIGEWRKKYPDCTNSESRKNDTYLSIVSNAMSGINSEEQSKNYEKIITKVAKEVTIEK